MTKRNYRRKAHFKPVNFGFGAMIVLGIVPWLFYSLVDMSNGQVAAQIRRLEVEKRAQEETLLLQTAEWNRLTEPHRLDEALARNGLRMKFAPPERTVHVAADGTMRLNRQLSQQLDEEVAALEGRALPVAMASVSRPAPVAAPPARRSARGRR